MAFLPPEPLTLTGGCFCKANRYTINIPGLEDRGLLVDALETPVGVTEDGGIKTVPTRFPLIDLDHCDSCRHSSGTILQCWLICPSSWVTWDLLGRGYDSHTATFDGKPKDVKGSSMSPPSGTRRNPIEIERITQVPSILAIGPEHPQQHCEGASSTPLTLTQPELLERTFITHYKTSPNVTRTFCSRCGTNLTYFMDRPISVPIPPVVDVTVGSLDTESAEYIRPDRHCWWEEALSWVKQLLLGQGNFLIRHPGGDIGIEMKD